MMSDATSEEDKQDFANEQKQKDYDSKVEDHISSMSDEDKASIIRYNSDHLGMMFDRHVFPCEDAEAWIDKHAELLVEIWNNRRIIIGLIEQQIDGNLKNEAESVIDDKGWQ